MAKKPKKPAPTAPDYAALDRTVEKMKSFPRPQCERLDRISTKLRFLGIVIPEEALCDEAQGGLGYILDGIADEIADISDDLSEEAKQREARA